MFDTRKFLLAHWTGARDLLNYMKQRGVRNVKYHQLHKWFRRGSLPGKWLGQLVCLLHSDKGSAPDLRKFRK
jgi:hypothetical protein